MCGRTCLTLEPHEIVCCSKYKDPIKKNISILGTLKKSDVDIKETENYLTPEWRFEYNCGKQYIPSYNIAPTDITPVIVNGKYFDDSVETRLLVMMMWGMIPYWHKGDYRKHGLSTNNCRLEHMLESKMFRSPFRKKQRCVVLCEGFYEWQTTKTVKPSERSAYLIYMKQDESVKIYDKSTWKVNNIKLLKLAGLFDVWEDENGDKMYSYSVITLQAPKTFSWLHHRTPAILETEEQINDWLDFNKVSDEKALAALTPAKNIEWHQVTNFVNNSRNKSDQCNKPVNLCKFKASPKNKIMDSWLIIRKRREEDIEKLTEKSDDENESTNKITNNIVTSTSAAFSSESEIENKVKRPKFRKSQRKL